MKGFDYSVAAYPTSFNGVNYRSRLEAKWAAFFERCGWGHEYEPCDLLGWTPDFRIVVLSGEAGLVEVKPIRDPWALQEPVAAACEAARAAKRTESMFILCGESIECAWCWLSEDKRFYPFVPASVRKHAIEIWKAACNDVQWRRV